MESKQSICICAGDPSADFPGSNLITQIRTVCPDIEVFGLGGPLMQQAGLKPMADYRELAVLGFWEIVPKYMYFRRLMFRMVDAIRDADVACLVLIDYPGFNLRLAERIKPLGIPVVYYISPQVWAWGQKRVAQIARLVDRMLVIFPFEAEFYREHGVNAEFVGHPIVDRYHAVGDSAQCRRALGLPAEARIIALLPGSRKQEIRRMLPVMSEAARRLKRKHAEMVTVIAGVDHIDEQMYRRFGSRHADHLIFGRTPDVVSAADFVITSSGTATVETAFFNTPMVVIYKTGFVTYQIARRLVKLDAIGMVNIVAGRKVVPELIQHEATGTAIARHTEAILYSPEVYSRTVVELQRVRRMLGAGATGRRTCEALMKVARLC